MESAAVRILALLGLTAVAASAALLCARPFVAAFDGVLKKWRRMGFVPRVVAVLMAAIATVEAQKSGMGDSNRVERVDRVDGRGGGSDFSRKEHKDRVGVNAEELKLMPETSTHLLASVKTNESYSYAMPASAVRYPNWWLRGGYEDVFKLELGDFSFPIGTNLVDYLWVYIWGKVRPRLKAKELEIAAVDSPMSAVPQVSEFWYMDGTNGSKILTWHNFFVGRIPLSVSNGSQSNCLTQSPQSPLSSPLCVSAQLELFANGDYIARSNLVERYFKRVNPDDWDDDGIPNIVDENPNGSDGDFFGPNNNLPEGANSNNYCWVEVAVSNVNSLVAFTGDKPSNLPDPYFVANAGESYAVNLLIGKTYRVTSAQPITCTAKSSDDIIVDQENERSMTIVYPVSYEIVDNARSVSRQVRLTPPLVGMYTWNTNTCCETEKRDGPYLPSCAPDCTCEGGCDTGGFTFSYEGYSLDFGGVACGCTPNEEDDEENQIASVSVSFSKSAIIYEEAYETAPGVTVPLRSSESTLSFEAHGGPKGGMVYVSLTDGNRLVKRGGSLPYTRYLDPGESVKFEIVCTGQGESSSEDDIVVSATFTENETDEVQTSEDKLTVVRVDFMPVLEAPLNPCIRRHKFGVREEISCAYQPKLQGVEWRNVGNGMFDGTQYICSLDVDERPIEVHYKDAEYTPLISVVTPIDIMVKKVEHKTFGVPINHAGGIGMKFELLLKPLDVCFSGIAVEEVPSDKGSREGYFAMPIFAELQSHTKNNGAGVWCKVGGDNDFATDVAAITNAIPRITPDGVLTDNVNFGWVFGRVLWDIPMGWGEYESLEHDEPYGIFDNSKKSEMMIYNTGRSEVRKFGHHVTRDINGDIYLDNRKVE